MTGFSLKESFITLFHLFDVYYYTSASLYVKLMLLAVAGMSEIVNTDVGLHVSCVCLYIATVCLLMVCHGFTMDHLCVTYKL